MKDSKREFDSSRLRAGCVAECPGCAHRSWSVADSEAQKYDWLLRRLAPWAETITPLQAVSGEARWGYRDRVCLATEWRNGQWHIGLYKNDEVLSIPDCPVHSPRVRSVVRLLLETMPSHAEFPLRWLVQSGAQLTLVVKSRNAPDLSWFTDDIIAALRESGIEGLWLHRHPASGRRSILAKNHWRLLCGEPRSRDEGGMLYGPAAFQQLIPALANRALEQAEAFLLPDSQNAVVDLYCGAGGTLRRWRQRGAKTIGVEIGAESLACAAANAPGAELLRGNCAQRLPQLREWVKENGASRLYVNPPRTGLEPEVCTWVTEEFRPERIGYLSCSAGTLARDLEQLTAADYRVETITPYDFFPQTWHVETLVLLQRLS